jgi:uncharacterized protein YjbI with pentapeptide repeats
MRIASLPTSTYSSPRMAGLQTQASTANTAPQVADAFTPTKSIQRQGLGLSPKHIEAVFLPVLEKKIKFFQEEINLDNVLPESDPKYLHERLNILNESKKELTSSLKTGKAPKLGLKLYELDFKGYNLEGVDLSWYDLSWSDLTEVQMNNAECIGTRFYSSKMNGVQLKNTNLFKSSLTHADLTNADLENAKLKWSHLNNANFTNANLTNANLTNVNAHSSRWTRAKLTHANLTKAQLKETVFSNADLTGTDLTGALLAWANLTGTDFNGAKFGPKGLNPTVLYRTLTDKNTSGLPKDLDYSSESYDKWYALNKYPTFAKGKGEWHY